MDLRVYTDQYIAAFGEDARALGLEEVEETPRATDEANLEAMADLIEALTRNGHTYVSDGSIYFKISTLPGYGRLARLDHEGMKDGARVDADTTRKTTRATSCCGRRASRASRPGMSSSRRDARDGISSARRWRCGCWASRRSTSTPAAST